MYSYNIIILYIQVIIYVYIMLTTTMIPLLCIQLRHYSIHKPSLQIFSYRNQTKLFARTLISVFPA